MGNQQQQQQRRGRSFVTDLLGVQMFFYATQKPRRRGGEVEIEEQVQADYNLEISQGTTVPVTVYPKEFIPTVWSPDQGPSARRFYTVNVHVFENDWGYYGHAYVVPGTALLDSEQIPLKRVVGTDVEEIFFRRRGTFGDGTPRLIGRSRKYDGRPVLLQSVVPVEIGKPIWVSLAEPRNQRPDNDMLFGRPMVVSKNQVVSDSPTVVLRAPTVLKKNVTEAKSTADFQHSTNKVSIYDVLSSKKMGIAVTAESRAWEIRRASEALMRASDPTLVKERIPTLPLIMEAQLGGIYDAIEAATEIALKIAIQKFGDEPEPMESEPRQPRRRNGNRNRNERRSEGRETAETATNEAATAGDTDTQSAATEAGPEAQATDSATENTDNTRDTLRPGAPPTFEEGVAVEVEIPQITDERIVAKAAELKVTTEVLERAFMMEVERLSAAGKAMSLEEYLAKDDRYIRFNCKRVIAELSKQ